MEAVDPFPLFSTGEGHTLRSVSDAGHLSTEENWT